MPYKRPGSSYYYVRRKNLVGYGDTGAITSKSRSRRVATAMERLLEDLAERALLEPKWHDLLDAVVDRKIDLPTLLRTKTERRLPALLRSLHDPPLSESIERFRPHANDRQTEIGLDKLLTLAPEDARLSLLTSARTLTDLALRCETEYDVNPNTVHRQFLRAISMLLRREYGNHERNRIFADVQYERPDDTREVILSPREIQRLFEAARELGYGELATLIRMALLTSADRGDLLRGEHADGFARGLLVKDVRLYEENGNYSGTVRLPGLKTKDRTRSVPFGDRLARELLLLAKGKKATEPAFDMKYRQLDYVWQRTRAAAEMGTCALRI